MYSEIAFLLFLKTKKLEECEMIGEQNASACMPRIPSCKIPLNIKICVVIQVLLI